MNRLGGQRNTAVIDVPSDWQTTEVVQSAGEFSSKNRQRPCSFPYFYPNKVSHGTFGRTEIQVDLWKRAYPEVINRGLEQWMIRY